LLFSFFLYIELISAIKNSTLKENKKIDEKENNIKRITNFVQYSKKPKLAFGYDYDPNILKNGINKYVFSHKIKDGRKLYIFKPRISCKIFPILSKLMGYELYNGSILTQGSTEIKSGYFVAKETSEKLLKI